MWCVKLRRTLAGMEQIGSVSLSSSHGPWRSAMQSSVAALRVPVTTSQCIHKDGNG